MRLRAAKPVLFFIVAVCLFTGACGAETTIETGGSGENGAVVRTCDDGVGEIAKLLGSGLPMYDYEPANDLADLIANSDLVVAGTLGSAQRVDSGTNDEEIEPVDSQVTQLEADEFEVLWASNEAVADVADIFVMHSGWPEGAGDDPLASPVFFEPAAVQFVAFLNLSEFWPAPVVGVQGLVVGCGGPAVRVIEPLPPDAAGHSVSELIDRVTEISRSGGGSADVGDRGDSLGRGETVPIPHRVLADGLADESQESWSTAVLSQVDIWDLIPDAELADPQTEEFFAFWLAESGSCPFGPLVDLHYDIEFQVIFPEVPLADGVGTDCEGDDNPHLIVVAIARSELPRGAFTLWVNGEEPWDEGSAFVADGELTTPSESAIAHEELGDPGELAVGATKVAIGLTTHCGLERLFWTIDGRQWVQHSRGDVLPEWEAIIRGEEIDLVITRTKPDELEVVALGTGEGQTYVPAPDIEGCA